MPFSGYRRPGQQDQGDCVRDTWHYRRDGIAPRALFRDHAKYWINLQQARYNLEVARDEFDAAIKQIKQRIVLGESYAHR